MPLRYHLPVLSFALGVLVFLLIGANGDVQVDGLGRLAAETIVAAGMAWAGVRADVKWIIKQLDEEKELRREDVAVLHKRIDDLRKAG